jgi:hypothetical protein
MDVWYEENDRVLSLVRGPPQTSRSSKCIPVLRSIYRTLAWCSLKTYLLAAITQHHAEEQLGRVCVIEAIPRYQERPAGGSERLRTLSPRDE